MAVQQGVPLGEEDLADSFLFSVHERVVRTRDASFRCQTFKQRVDWISSLSAHRTTRADKCFSHHGTMQTDAAVTMARCTRTKWLVAQNISTEYEDVATLVHHAGTVGSTCPSMWVEM